MTAKKTVYVAPKIAFIAAAHHHFALLGGAHYDADGAGFVWNVPPHHYGAMVNAGAVPIIINHAEVAKNAVAPGDDDDDDDDVAEAKAESKAHVHGGKFPGMK